MVFGERAGTRTQDLLIKSLKNYPFDTRGYSYKPLEIKGKGVARCCAVLPYIVGLVRPNCAQKRDPQHADEEAIRPRRAKSAARRVARRRPPRLDPSRRRTSADLDFPRACWR